MRKLIFRELARIQKETSQVGQKYLRVTMQEGSRQSG